MPPQINPIVVDLDGTLIKTDMLFESANQFIAENPLRFWQPFVWLMRGRPYLKEQLAQRYQFDPASLPYNEEVLAWLRSEAANGTPIYLATASNKAIADAVAEHLKLFTGVFASEGDINLKASRKCDRLIAEFGERQFDYVGNEGDDLAVWEKSKQAHVVSSSNALLAQVAVLGNQGKLFASQAGGLMPLLKAMRLHQWVKNLLVFLPLLGAHEVGNVPAFIQACLAFLAFGLCASSVYLLNDLVDIENDRHHARKRARPFASGQLSILTGWLLWPILTISAFILAWLTLPLAFTGVLLVYFAVTLAYSFSLKRYAVLDVLVLAGLYTIRIVAGAVATGIPLSFWLLTFSMFIFLSLAFMKRYSELKLVKNVGQEGKLPGRGYAADDLEAVSTMGIVSGYLSILVLALYIHDGYTAVLYRSPQIIWLACPLMLYWVSRTWLITHRGAMNDDPVMFAIKDRVSHIVAACFLLIFVVAAL
jgi:4-hydroxybenzoate polyprenyltransferase